MPVCFDLTDLIVIYTFINFFLFNLFNHLSIHVSIYPCIHSSIHTITSMYPFIELFISLIFFLVTHHQVNKYTLPGCYGNCGQTYPNVVTKLSIYTAFRILFKSLLLSNVVSIIYTCMLPVTFPHKFSQGGSSMLQYPHWNALVPAYPKVCAPC